MHQPSAKGCSGSNSSAFAIFSSSSTLWSAAFDSLVNVTRSTKKPSSGETHCNAAPKSGRTDGPVIRNGHGHVQNGKNGILKRSHSSERYEHSVGNGRIHGSNGCGPPSVRQSRSEHQLLFSGRKPRPMSLPPGDGPFLDKRSVSFYNERKKCDPDRFSISYKQKFPVSYSTPGLSSIGNKNCKVERSSSSSGLINNHNSGVKCGNFYPYRYNEDECTGDRYGTYKSAMTGSQSFTHGSFFNNSRNNFLGHNDPRREFIWSGNDLENHTLPRMGRSKSGSALYKSDEQLSLFLDIMNTQERFVQVNGGYLHC